MRRPCLALAALLLPLLGCGGLFDCPEGYLAQDGDCVDIDECTATNPPDRHECGPNGVCLNRPGGYSCSFTHPDPPAPPAPGP